MSRKEAALDTSVLIDLFREDPTVFERIAEVEFLWIPVPVIAEMEFGFPRLKNADPHKKRFDAMLSRKDVEIIVCDRKVAEQFSVIKRHLRKKGAMIPVNDIWIAACCATHGKTLVTRDSDFRRVPGLGIEMW
jgi:tRNA(fMet)-specific endonuclease VapC